MTRRLLPLVGLLCLLLPAAAAAHPLGDYSVNHLAQIGVSADRVEVGYVLDRAEIASVPLRGRSDAAVLREVEGELARRLVLEVDGRRAPLEVTAARLSRPPGRAGLPTTRAELALRAAAADPERVVLRDGTYPGRAGWRAIVVRPGEGTAVRSDGPATDPTDGLRRYPLDELESPADVRTATLRIAPGAGTVAAPAAPEATAGAAAQERGGDPLTDAFSDAVAGRGALLVALALAFGWGALHALSPGHGKAMVAAYLVGTRGTPRHALALGAIVTVTHTAGVFGLGLVALALSSAVLPENLLPWLELASGLLVLGVGAAVLRRHVRRRPSAAHGRHHHHHHDHEHHAHEHHHDGHGHLPPEHISSRGLLAMGAAAGLIPCPSALVVLLAAIAQGEILLGLALIVAFSAGLAATLAALGLAVVLAGRALGRVAVPRAVVVGVPAVSAAAIVALGCMLTAQAVGHVA
jgi:ABC-type nickel/cobalt efflux system permease component RcnA